MNCEQYPASRLSYEGGQGGWNDGRLGQAYDLIYSAMIDMGFAKPSNEALLSQIEILDKEVQSK